MTVATTTLFETPGSFVFTLPSNYVTGDDLLVLRGAGGGGCNGAAKSDGGGGGARATTTSPGYVAGGYVKLTIGAGGSGTGSAGGAGGDTTAVVGAVTFVAKGGQGGTGTGTGGEGGQASACNPTAGAFSGGNGGSNGVTGAWIAGGGGAAGNVANGNPGGNGVGSTQTSGAGGNSGNDDNGGAAVTSGNGNPGGNAAPLDGGGGGGSGSGPANADTGGNGGFPGGGGGAAYSGSSPGGAGAGGYAKLMFGASATPVYPGLTITNALGTVTAGGSVDATVDVTGYAGVPALVWQISGGGASGTVDVSSGTVTIDAGPFTTTGQTLAVASSINPYMTATSTAVTISGGSGATWNLSGAPVAVGSVGSPVAMWSGMFVAKQVSDSNGSLRYLTYNPATEVNLNMTLTGVALAGYSSNTLSAIVSELTSYLANLPIGSNISYFGLIPYISLVGTPYFGTFEITGFTMALNPSGLVTSNGASFVTSGVTSGTSMTITGIVGTVVNGQQIWYSWYSGGTTQTITQVITIVSGAGTGPLTLSVAPTVPIPNGTTIYAAAMGTADIPLNFNYAPNIGHVFINGALVNY